MEKEIRQILVTLIEISMQSDCEMFNMGDWPIEQVEKRLALKQDAIAKLIHPESGTTTIPPEFVYQATHDIILYFRSFITDEGMDKLQKIEHDLAKYIYRNFR